MHSYEITFKRFGDRALLIEWPQKIDDAILDDIARMRNALTHNLKRSKDIVDVVAAYHSITIFHHYPIVNFAARIDILKKIYAQSQIKSTQERFCYQVPVCYEPALASELDNYLQLKNLTLERFIQLHTDKLYRVCFFGFVPGFMYLSGLDSNLYCPRKATPTASVPKGAVAIGGQQTGIYPSETPGGWHVIGMSPIEFIGEQSGSLGIVQAGDRIRFQAISLDEYQSLKQSIKAGTYTLKRELWKSEDKRA